MGEDLKNVSRCGRRGYLVRACLGCEEEPFTDDSPGSGHERERGRRGIKSDQVVWGEDYIYLLIKVRTAGAQRSNALQLPPPTTTGMMLIPPLARVVSPNPIRFPNSAAA